MIDNKISFVIFFFCYLNQFNIMFLNVYSFTTILNYDTIIYSRRG
nr:MAG TPA: hypothetical protein [Bacteriophage sp.]